MGTVVAPKVHGTCRHKTSSLSPSLCRRRCTWGRRHNPKSNMRPRHGLGCCVVCILRIRLAMGNVSVCAHLQSPNRRETADVHSDRKSPYAARSTCSHQPLGHHSARSAQPEKTPHLCIIWSLFSVAIGGTARATNSCISLLTQMPADKTEWELMVIRENQKALTVKK